MTYRAPISQYNPNYISSGSTLDPSALIKLHIPLLPPIYHPLDHLDFACIVESVLGCLPPSPINPLLGLGLRCFSLHTH